MSASHDNTARIWDAATGKCEVVWEGHTFIPSLPDNRQFPDGVFISSGFEGLKSVSFQPSFLDICNDIIFHTINLHKICVPPPFRNPTTITYYLSKICLGYASGEVLLLEVCVAYIIFHICY